MLSMSESSWYPDSTSILGFPALFVDSNDMMFRLSLNNVLLALFSLFCLFFYISFSCRIMQAVE